jgi:hypothetical protein
MVALDLDIDLGAQALTELPADLAPMEMRIGMERGELAGIGVHRLMVNGDARAVGTALGHADQHRLDVSAELRPQGRVLEEQADNSAHGTGAFPW